MKEFNEAYYLHLLIQCLFISKIEVATIFAPLESAIGFDLAYHAPFGPPLSDMVVDLKSAHIYASGCKNISNYLLHLCLFESQVRTDVAMDELNQAFQHKL
jgi:hypothetical protein